MKATLPESTEERRRAAIAASNAARRERVQLKGELGAGDITLSDALDDDRAQRIYVYDILRALPGVGAKTAQRVMVEVGIWGNRRVRGLGRNQRAALVEWERSRGTGGGRRAARAGR